MCAGIQHEARGWSRRQLNLTQRIAIGCGEILICKLGGSNGKWLNVFAGHPIVDAGRACDVTTPGEVLLTPRLARFAHRRSGQRAWTTVMPGWTGWTAAAAAVQQRPPVGARAGPARGLPARRAGASREIRPGRVAGGVPRRDGDVRQAGQHRLRRAEGPDDAAGADLLDPGGRASLRRRDAVRADGRQGPELRHRVRHSDGRVRRRRGACADAPAWTFSTPCGGIGVRPSIGVATGILFCGECGAAQRRQYSMIGPAINFAARLAGAAPDDLLCDEETAKAVRDRLSFTVAHNVRPKHAEATVLALRPDWRDKAPTAAGRGVWSAAPTSCSACSALLERAHAGQRRAGAGQRRARHRQVAPVARAA